MTKQTHLSVLLITCYLYKNSVNLWRARLLLHCTHLGRDWLSTQSAVAGVTFMNEFAPYAMQAPPLKRRTRQRFTEFDYSWYYAEESALLPQVATEPTVLWTGYMYGYSRVYHRKRKGEPVLPILPHIMVLSAKEQKLGLFGSLLNSMRKLTVQLCANSRMLTFRPTSASWDLQSRTYTISCFWTGYKQNTKIFPIFST